MEEKKNAPPIIVRVQRPDLSPEERAKRMEEIKRAATSLLVSVYRDNPELFERITAPQPQTNTAPTVAG